MKQWDVFISHASEDKETVALPLCALLRRAGLKVWLDRQELHLGDSLREKIDEGLANSRFGVVVLSPGFIAKGWPRRELNGLMAVEESGQKVILPIWHRIDKQTLAEYSPILADRLAADTSRGIQEVASEIIAVVVRRGSGSPSAESPTLVRRLVELLDTDPNSLAIKDFLSSYPHIATRALGAQESQSVLWSVRMADFALDLCVEKLLQPTIGSRLWCIVQFERSMGPLFTSNLDPTPEIASRVNEMEGLRRWVGKNLGQARRVLPTIAPNFQCTVVSGRRASLSPQEVERLREYNDQLFGIQVRTYDFLIDAAITI
jgi:hypothetical protein